MKRAVQSIIAAAVLTSASSAHANSSGMAASRKGHSATEAFDRSRLRDSRTLPGWSVNDNSLAWYTKGYEPNPLKPIGVGPHSGDLAINMCHGSVANLCDGSVRPASLSQTFTILPFIEQQVSFWVGNYSGNGGPVSIGVTITDGTSNTLFVRDRDGPADRSRFGSGGSSPIPTSPGFPTGRRRHDVFSEIGGGAYAGLDDITIVAAPEPSTWALGLLGLGVLRMRRATPQGRLSRPGISAARLDRAAN